MYSKSKKIEIMIGKTRNKIINELFSSLFAIYLIGLKTSVKGSHFPFDSIDGLHWKYHRISVNHGGLYRDSPDWIKKKKATLNPKKIS